MGVSVTGVRFKKLTTSVELVPFRCRGRGTKVSGDKGHFMIVESGVFREVESSTPLHKVWEDLGSGVLSSITSQV